MSPLIIILCVIALPAIGWVAAVGIMRLSGEWCTPTTPVELIMTGSVLAVALLIACIGTSTTPAAIAGIWLGLMIGALITYHMARRAVRGVREGSD